MIPKKLKNIRELLGSTWYYHKFVQNYGRIATSISTFFKKESFSLTSEETKSFEQLKEAMCSAPILTTPDTKTFIVESDASENGIDVDLMQVGWSVYFESWPIKGKNLQKPIYEKEIMAIVNARKQLRPFLIGRKFKVKPYNHSLKYFLE